MGLCLRMLKDGTRSDTRLCDSCERSQIMKGCQQGQEIVWCHSLDKYLPFPISDCTSYSRKGEMSEYEAKEIGWVLESKAGKVVGFKPPKKEYQD